MDDQLSQFRKHARRSRELARAAETDHERVLHEEIAAHWEALAELWRRAKPPQARRS